MSSYPQHIPALDGVRGAAALIVVFSHFSTLQPDFLGGVLGFSAAHIGVMLFFVLSGFLMGHLYFGREFSAANIGDFFQKRIARVMPMYWFVVAVSFSIVALANHWHPFWYATRQSNLLDHLLLIRADSILWTVVVETNFYLLFPLFWFIARKGKAWLITILLAAFTLNALIDTPKFWQETLRVFSGAGNFFLAGLLLAVLPAVDTRKYKFATNAAFMCAALLVVLSFPGILSVVTNGGLGCNSSACIGDTMSGMYEGFAYLILVSVFLFTVLNSTWGAKVFSQPLMRWFGKISYSLYLLHIVVIWYWRRFTGIDEYSYFFFPVALATMFAASALTYHLIENPSRIWINRIKVPPEVRSRLADRIKRAAE